jgi:sucrose-6-phosphate hydrolase SacC (GH32 family)
VLFPVELTLRTTDDGLRLFAEPVKEIEKLHRKEHSWQDVSIAEDSNLLKGIEGELFHIKAVIDIQESKEIGFVVRGTAIRYDVANQQLACQQVGISHLDATAPMKPQDGKIQLEVLVDRRCIEIFGNKGRVYMPMWSEMPDDDKTLKLYSKGGAAKIETLKVYELTSVWNQIDTEK